ncbi:uncharacterized protein [Pagrus major]|uniref:uncharacterized protein n=1 Tax=Pagrus major TaxID=143350 RepID=UPI003CC885BA
MDLKDSLVKGGVLINHQIHEGKHQYEVENVVKYKKASGGKPFARRGDKLMEINGIDVQNLTPEELAQMLADGNPKLTVHKTGRIKEHPELSSPAEETLCPFSKESTVLSFSMEMKREEDLEENEVEQEGEGRGSAGIVEDVCKDAENGEGSDLLIVTMTKTSISVVSGRGCKDGSPCPGCQGSGCTLNDVVVVAESSTVVLVPRGSGSFRVEKPSDVEVEHVATHYYLRGLCPQRTLYASPNPEKITIYYYKSNIVERIFRGTPVVLNFTGSNCFMRCCKEGDRVRLQVETCETQTLTQISKSDKNSLSYVFYMKSNRTKQRTFESALHLGWFIQIVNTDFVEMGTLDRAEGERAFLFIIKK